MLVDTKEENAPKRLPKKTIAIVIKNGKRPLHGTNALVIVAISRSRGESIIRHPNYSSCITAKPHAHGKSLLTRSTRLFKKLI